MKNTYSRLIPVFLLVLLLGPMPAHAQALLSLEGPIQRVIPDQNAMVVMGVRVTVPPGTPITTPTTTLTALADLLGNPLPGRIGANGLPLPGFVGGTAIINGRVTAAGALTATDVFVEPAENVMIGTITAATCSNANCVGAGNTISINRVRLVPIRDPRLAAGPVTNEFGFAANLAGAANLVGRAAEAEGYFAGGRFNYYLFSVTGAPAANAGAEVSITRARCTEDPAGILLDVLGNTHPSGAGESVTVSDGAGTTFGTQPLIAADVAGFGAYTFRLRNNAAFSACPANVTVEFGTVSVTSGVVIP